MKFKEIYLNGTEEFIEEILKISREELGKGCNAIDLEPTLRMKGLREKIKDRIIENDIYTIDEITRIINEEFKEADQ